MEKATLGFRIYKIWQILKRFVGTFHRAQTLKLGGVTMKDHTYNTKKNVYRVSCSISSYMAMQLHCTYKITTSCRTLMELLMKNCVKEVGIKFFLLFERAPKLF